MGATVPVSAGSKHTLRRQPLSRRASSRHALHLPHRSNSKHSVDSEDRSHDLEIMGPTRCQLRYIHLASQRKVVQFSDRHRSGPSLTGAAPTLQLHASTVE